jgi:hypothetical protein
VLLANAALLAVLPNAEFLAIGAGTNPTTGATELILTRYLQQQATTWNPSRPPKKAAAARTSWRRSRPVARFLSEGGRDQ